MGHSGETAQLLSIASAECFFLCLASRGNTKQRLEPPPTIAPVWQAYLDNMEERSIETLQTLRTLWYREA